MRKIIIAKAKSKIVCKHVRYQDVDKHIVEDLRKKLLKAEYTFAESLEDLNFYIVKCDGQTGVGVGPCEGEAVTTDLEGTDAEDFYYDEPNVKFIEFDHNLIYKPTKEYIATNPKDLTRMDKVYVRSSIDYRKYEKVVFLGHDGFYDGSYPIWTWKTKDGRTHRSYSAMFYIKVVSTFDVQYYDCGDWYTTKRNISKVKAENFIKQNKGRYQQLRYLPHVE
jgi:hypothetical protein